MPNQDQIPYSPQSFDFRPEFTTPVLNVLRYQADALLALTLPRVKHGSAELIPPTYAQDFQSDQGTVLALKPLAGNTTFFTVGQTQISGNTSAITLLSPTAARSRWTSRGDGGNAPGALSVTDYRPSSQYDGDGRAILDSLAGVGRGGQDASPQAEALASNTITRFRPIGDVGSIGRYRTMAYAELQRAPRASPNEVIHTGTIQTRGVSDVTYDRDFVDLIINDIKFRAYLTNFTDNFVASWSDLQYIGRQDVLKVYKGTTRNISIAFKTAAFTKNDLAEMYRKINQLINTGLVGKIDPTYIRAPLTQLTLGKWFVKTPCVINSIKLDAQPTEYSWDVGSTRDRSAQLGEMAIPDPSGLSDSQADSRQMPMIVDISMDLSILGDADGQTLNGSNNHFSKILQQ